MIEPEFEAGRASEVAGTPEGDGDFESDLLPETGETSAGGQVSTRNDALSGTAGRAESHTGLAHVIDEISSGKIQP
jgi:hypothetical protein